MRIWYFNNYTMLPEHGPFNRGYYLGKYLKQLGHEPIVFAGSHPHNTDLQLIEDNAQYKVYQKKPFPWVLIKTRKYGASRKQQILSMFEYYCNAKKAIKKLHRPDVVIGSSAHPLAALLAIRLAKKNKCKGIVEVRDLWPESIVEYGILSKSNPIIKLMYRFELYLYKKADAIVFTIGGGYQYICDQGWDTFIPKSKVSQINNGIDLEMFDDNKLNNIIEDEDLLNEEKYKIIYTGTLKKANEQIYTLFDAIKKMQGKRYEDLLFLIYGRGELKEKLKEQCEKYNYTNVRIKGYVDKKYIPYILSKCDLAILNCSSHKILRYGGSQNKQFDYLAAGLPIITGEDSIYSITKQYQCGIAREFNSAEDIVRAIMEMKNDPMPKDHIRAVAERYDFRALAQDFIKVIENIQEV